MSYTKCVYHNCNNTSRNISMFRFPVHDEGRLLVWIRNSGNKFLDSLTADELRYRYLCADHFRTSCISHGKQRSRLLGPAVPFHFEAAINLPCHEEMEIDSLHSPETLKVNGTSETVPTYSAKMPQVLRDPLQDFANKTEEPKIKEEPTHDEDSSFIKFLRYEDESEDHTQTKLARCNPSIVMHNYAQQLYKFGKYVAEQLLCLDLEKARLVQKEIRDLLLKHCQNIGVTDTSVQPATNWRCDTLGHKIINLATSSVKSSVKVSKSIRSSVAQSPLKLNCSSPSEIPSSSKLYIIRPQVPQSVLHVNTIRPQAPQSALQVNDIIRLKMNCIRPSGSQSESPSPSSKKYVILPQVTALDHTTVQVGNTITSPVTQTPVDPAVTMTQTESLHVKMGDIAELTELDTCSENVSGIKVKTEPECESAPSYLNDTWPKVSTDRSSITQLPLKVYCRRQPETLSSSKVNIRP